MDFDFDLDDLGDLDNLECDWDDAVNRQNSGRSQKSQPPPPPPQAQSSPRQQQNGHNGHQNSINPGDNEQYQVTPSDDNGSGAAGQQLPISTHSVDSTLSTPGISNAKKSTGDAGVYQIRLDREREGRCAECGAQTHDVQFDPSGSGRSVKVPLTVPNEVHRGRCLFCHPLPTNHSSGGTRGGDGGSFHNRGDGDVRGDGSIHSMGGNGGGGHYQQQLQHPQEPMGQLDRHLNAHGPSPGQHQREQLGSNVSVYSANSQKSSRSIYSQHSHQSAPNWGQQTPQQHRQTPNLRGQDFVENYQQQNQYLQSQQVPDDGSVYSQRSNVSHHSHHSIHSNASYHSNASHHSYNPPIASSQVNPLNVDTSFQRSGSSCSSHSQLSHSNEYGPRGGAAAPAAFADPSEASAAEMIYQQLVEAEGSGNLDVEKVLQAMQRFMAHAPLQEKGCNIVWLHSNQAEHCSALSQLGAVPILLDAMRTHPQDAALQRAACEGLRNLCIHPIPRQQMLRGRGVPLIVGMMTTHVNNPDIQRSGCEALAGVSQGGMECKISVAECGGILAVMKAVEIHPENDLVLRSAYTALRMLGYNPGAKPI